MIRPYELLSKPRKALSDMEVLKRIRRGIPISALTNLSNEFSVSKDMVCTWLGFSPRTMLRRDVLNIDEADRLYRLARVFALAINVLEDKQQAIEWLNTPKIALDNQVPLSLLNTGVGSREVEKLLKRIEHGVYS